MRRLLGIAVTVSLLSATASGAHRVYLKKSEVFCDVAQVICLRGSLTYEPNSRILQLHARVQKQVRPGTIAMTFTGTNRLGVLKRTEITIDVRGKSSEIVNKSIRPDAPDVSNWELSTFSYREPMP